MQNYLDFIPEKFRINQEIPLDVFCKNATMSTSKKQKFLMYCSSVNVIGKVTDGKNEIIILNLSIKSKRIDKYDLMKFLKSVFEGIPYPIWILLDYKKQSYKFVAENYHQKQNGYGNIVDNLRWSFWVDADSVDFNDERLFNDIESLLANPGDIKKTYETFKEILQQHYESRNEARKREDELCDIYGIYDDAILEIEKEYDYIEETFENML